MNYDVIVLGSGPGGYVTAIRASQLGMKTAVIEKESLGGVCLNWGCIPTKALLKSANVYEYINHAEDYGIKVSSHKADFSAVVKRSRSVAEKMSGGVQFLMKKNKIDVIMGTGKVMPGKTIEVTDDKGKTSSYTAKNIIIATGARSRQLPNLEQDGKQIIGYREAMVLPKMPKKMVIVGSGAIGVEFAYFYNAMGVDVTVVEFLPNIVPVEDIDVSKQLEKTFKKKGMNITADVHLMNLCFNESRVLEFDTVFKTLPVLRSQDNVEALWKALKDETIDFIVSDHRPAIKEEKELEFEHASFGAPQLKTVYSALNTRNKLPLDQLIEILSNRPRTYLGVPKGTIKEGTKADLTLFDPKDAFEYGAKTKKEEIIYSPFQNENMKGRVIGIINNNKVILNQ